MSLFSGFGSSKPADGNTSAASNPSSAPAAPSLFPKLNTDPKPAGSTPSLFSTPISAAQAGPSLFSNLKPAAQAGHSLFSNLKPAAQAGHSLFSNPQNQGTSSLFGARPASTAQTQAQANQPGQGQPGQAQPGQAQPGQGQPDQGHSSQQGQLLTSQSNQGASQVAYFQNLLEKNKKRSREAEKGSIFGDVPGLKLGLNDISKRVRDLGSTDAEKRRDGADDTRAHYLLAASGVNPGRAIRDLDALDASRPAVTAPAPLDWDPDSHKYVEQLQQQMTAKMIADGLARSQRDFDNYLQEHVDMDWEAQRQKIYAHFGLNVKGSGRSLGQNAERGGFGRSSRRERDTNGDGSRRAPMNRSIFNQSGMHKSVIGTPAGGGRVQTFDDSADPQAAQPPPQDDRYQREKQQRFATKVQRLNESRQVDVNYPILAELSEVEGSLRGDCAPQLIDAYKALREITGEANEGGVRPRAYAESYLDDAPKSQRSSEMRRRILIGSRIALERQFYEHLCAVVDRNPQEANVGGSPTRLQRVRAYIRVREARRDLAPDGVELRRLENGDYCWAVVYFLLRCGFIREAADYVASRGSAFATVDRTFATYMTTYAHSEERRLSPANQAKINNEYTQRLRSAPESALDPYRMACMKIIGRCELAKRSLDGLSQGVEDWIWLQFCMAREANRAEELATEVYGLEQVQETIREIGTRHFSKGSDNAGGFGTFFYLQILGGLFENAVDYLYSYSYTSAVHFAVGLAYYGLLRVSDFAGSVSELLTMTTQEQPQINFSRMIGFYTRDFRAENVVAATDYLVLICLNADLPGELGNAQAAVCHEALRELVLETREFAQLLGDMYTDGTNVQGAIQRRERLLNLPDRETYVRAVTLQAASVADTNGRATDAVLLYHLAEDYNHVMMVINRAMSDALTVDPGTEPQALQPLRPRNVGQDGQQAGQNDASRSSLSLAGVDNPQTLAQHFTQLYYNNARYAEKVDHVQRGVSSFLMDLWEARRCLSDQRWAESMSIISRTGMLPLAAHGNIAIIRSSAQRLSTAPPVVGRLIGPMLLWTLECISRRRQGATDGGGVGAFETQARTELVDGMTGIAKDLMVFAGLVKLRMQRTYWEAIVSAAADEGML